MRKGRLAGVLARVHLGALRLAAERVVKMKKLVQLVYTVYYT